MELYSYLFRIIVWGVVIWAIYVAFTVTRLTNTLLRQPLRVVIFDLRPFQPIGRQSLWLSLMFVGGMTLGLLSSNFAEEALRLEYLISNTVIMALIVAIFFSTRTTYTVSLRPQSSSSLSLLNVTWPRLLQIRGADRRKPGYLCRCHGA